MKVFVIKHALTKGIVACDAEIKGDYAIVNTGNPFNPLRFSKGEWYQDGESALTAAKNMAARKAAQLRQQADKVATTDFSLPLV